jgi:DNA-binding NarL/FixJ family response regulator
VEGRALRAVVTGEQSTDDEFSPIRVLLADRENLVRAGLRALLERGDDITVAAEAANGHEVVALASEIGPDVLLIDVRLPGWDGLEATRRITADSGLSKVNVLIMGEEERDDDLFGAFRAGATGFLVKDAEPRELLRAVRVVARGDVQLSPLVTRRLVARFASQPDTPASTPDPFDELSAREREVVGLVALGLTNHEIAERLVVSPATAKTHVSRSMVKLQVRDRAKLVALAYQTGFAQPGIAQPPGRCPVPRRLMVRSPIARRQSDQEA